MSSSHDSRSSSSIEIFSFDQFLCTEIKICAQKPHTQKSFTALAVHSNPLLRPPSQAHKYLLLRQQFSLNKDSADHNGAVSDGGRLHRVHASHTNLAMRIDFFALVDTRQEYL